MIKLNPYLTFAGTGKETIELYKKAFKVEPDSVMTFKDMPPSADGQEGVALTPEAAERILHASLTVGKCRKGYAHDL
jgi:PhnB protein